MSRKNVLLTTVLIAGVFACASLFAGEGKKGWMKEKKAEAFPEHKAQILTHLNKKIEHIQKKKACIEAATEHKALRNCHKQYKEEGKSMREQHKGWKNKRKEARQNWKIERKKTEGKYAPINP
jgi:hypothetical protein